MSTRSRQKILMAEEISRPFVGDWADRYPPILSVEQVSEWLGISRSTLYEWISKERLDGCFRRRGKHIRVWRDKLIDKFFNDPEWT